ncbi:hypothetical protein BA190_19770 [Labrys sp. WJW]|nr:hypothetical protein BA190_19770 [Labrys sp. WJW]
MSASLQDVTGRWEQRDFDGNRPEAPEGLSMNEGHQGTAIPDAAGGDGKATRALSCSGQSKARSGEAVCLLQLVVST